MTDEPVVRKRGRPKKATTAPDVFERMAEIGAHHAKVASNGTLPRAERNCGNCDFSRLVVRELRCWLEPPSPTLIGMLPPLHEGGQQRPVVIGVQTPTWPWYVCPKWAHRQPDHPDIGVTETMPLAAIEAEMAAETRQ